MGTGRWVVVAAFVLAAAGIVWWYLPGLVARVNTGTMAEIVIHAAFPILAVFFCLYMAVRMAFSRESGRYQDNKRFEP
ncbi:MAG: hypothetical protein AAFZ01_03375 [Pseudomonadota bacterium]